MNSLGVAKFGGTSMSTMYDEVKEKASHFSHIVVSAPGKRNANDKKLTDLLTNHSQVDVNSVIERFSHMTEDRGTLLYLSQELNNRLNGGNKDEILAFGEYASAYTLAHELGEGFQFLDAKDCIIEESGKGIRYVGTGSSGDSNGSSSKKLIIPGFYYRGEDGQIKTFSRGGSDISGAIIASSTSKDYFNFSDSCICNADPRVIENPSPIDEMTYRELRHLTNAGFNIVHEDVWRIMEESARTLTVMGTQDDLKSGHKTTILNSRINGDKSPYLALGLIKNVVSIDVDNSKGMDFFDFELESRLKKIGKSKLTALGATAGTTYLFRDVDTLTYNTIVNSFKEVGSVTSTNENLYGLVVVGQGMKGRKGTLVDIIQSTDKSITAIGQEVTEDSIIIFLDKDGEDFSGYNRVYERLFRVKH